MNNNDKLNLIKKINNISDIIILNEIFKIIDNHTKNYTTNKNGIFINVNNIDDNILEKIDKFINYTNNINNILDKSKNKIDIKQIETKVTKKIDIKKSIIKKDNNNIELETKKLIFNYPYNLILKKCKEKEEYEY